MNVFKKYALTGLFICGMSFGVSPFSLPWMNNAQQAQINFDSTGYPDGIFVVEAYFKNCPHCNNNAPRVDAFATEFQNQSRVHVLDVGVDRSDSDYKAWIQQHNPNHPVLKDAEEQLISELGTSGYPSTYVIDCKGNVVAQTIGEWSSSSKAKLEKAVNGLLAQQCQAN